MSYQTIVKRCENTIETIVSISGDLQDSRLSPQVATYHLATGLRLALILIRSIAVELEVAAEEERKNHATTLSHRDKGSIHNTSGDLG